MLAGVAAPGVASAATAGPAPQVDFPATPQAFGGGPAGTNNRAEIDLAALLVRRQQVIGSTLRSRSAADKAQIVASFRARFGAALEAGRIRPVIDRVLPLEHAGEAHRIMKASEHFGKIVLRVA